MNRKIIVAGVYGVSGRAAAERFASQPETEVIGISRRSSTPIEGVTMLSVDLLNPEEVREKLGDVRDVTHIVFGAYVEKATAAERSSVNVAILKNLLDVVEESSPQLEHVTFYQGGKAYGADLGPFKTPAREDEPRLMPPNFYYDQEDLLRERRQGKAWSFTALLPEAICGFATGNPMNLLTVIAVYAAISKELGIPLRFPGTEAAYKALYQVSSAEILAEATDWAGTTDAARNEIFNITNGDYFRWQYLWPKIAEMFDMDWADPVPMPLSTYMTDKAPLWDQMTSKYSLEPIPYDEVASWNFGDAIFGTQYDNITSTIKARRAGFASCIDSEDMFREQFARLRALNIIPSFADRSRMTS